MPTHEDVDPLGVGIAWSGPIKHIVQNGWPTAGRVFPGFLLEA